MKRITYWEDGLPYVKVESSFMQAIDRLAKFEDAVEAAESIQNDMSKKKNMLELHPKAKSIAVDKEQRERMNELKEAFSNVFYKLDDLCDGSDATKQAYLRLEESLFWATKSISREKAGE